jgi:hypothetical protein
LEAIFAVLRLVSVGSVCACGRDSFRDPLRMLVTPCRTGKIALQSRKIGIAGPDTTVPEENGMKSQEICAANKSPWLPPDAFSLNHR